MVMLPEPAHMFKTRNLSVEEVVSSLESALLTCRNINPSRKVVCHATNVICMFLYASIYLSIYLSDRINHPRIDSYTCSGRSNCESSTPSPNSTRAHIRRSGGEKGSIRRSRE